MILTLKTLVGQQGKLGDEGVLAPRRRQNFNRIPLAFLACSAAALGTIGTVGAGWHLAKADAPMTLLSLFVAGVGIYFFLGIWKEWNALSFVEQNSDGLSSAAKEELIKTLITANSNSVFRLVELLLQLVEKSFSPKVVP
jgi:hypothetical protein